MPDKDVSLKQVQKSLRGEIIESVEVEGAGDEGRRSLFVKFQSGRAMEFIVTGEHLLFEISTLLPKKETEN